MLHPVDIADEEIAPAIGRDRPRHEAILVLDAEPRTLVDQGVAFAHVDDGKDRSGNFVDFAEDTMLAALEHDRSRATFPGLLQHLIVGGHRPSFALQDHPPGNEPAMIPLALLHRPVHEQEMLGMRVVILVDRSVIKFGQRPSQLAAHCHVPKRVHAKYLRESQHTKKAGKKQQEMSTRVVYNVTYDIPRVNVALPGRQNRAGKGELRITSGITEVMEFHYGNVDGLPINLTTFKVRLVFWFPHEQYDQLSANLSENIVLIKDVEVLDPYAGKCLVRLTTIDTESLARPGRKTLNWSLYLLASDGEVFATQVNPLGERHGIARIETGMPTGETIKAQPVN